MHTPNGAGHVPRFSPGFVQVSRSALGHALAGRSFQERSARQDRPGRTAGRRRPPVPTSTPRRRRRASTHSAQHRRRTSTALPARALFIYPGRFSSPQTAPAPWPYNSRYRECPRPRSSGGCTGADAFPYNLRLYGIKSALPGRQHERGIPLSNSPHCRGPAPHTPRQRFAAAPRPAPGAGLAETPHAVSPASFRVTPAGASTARSSHAPAPPYHSAVRTRRRVTDMTHGQPAASTPRRRPIAQPNTGRRGAPTFALASLDLARCLRRPSAQTAAAGSLCQRQHLPPPQSVHVFRTPAAA